PHDRRDPHTRRAQAPDGVLDFPSRGNWVEAARVGDEARAAVEHERQRGRKVEGQVARVADRLVALAVLLQDGQGQLGQRFAHQVVDARVEQVGHGADAVAVEALAATEPHDALAGHYRPASFMAWARTFST